MSSDSPATPATSRKLPPPTVTHTAPFLVFMGFLALKGLFKESGQYPPGTPWYLTHADQWIYPLQTLTCLALIAWWWPAYPIHRIKPSTALLAIMVGAAPQPSEKDTPAARAFAHRASRLCADAGLHFRP